MSNRAIQNLFACYSEQLKNTKQSLKNLKAIDALTHCRTRALGASYYRCKLNHAEIEQLHSCRHRSCYVCAHKQRLDWVERQKARLLNVPHFHVIFTLPHEYLPLSVSVN
ncbi:transposase zinc-binding domain-containing protein [Denitrificimonas halotolerans]|uniref:transposase zinc-binding domain-containing protein n=1 Tax=Denitrificimonas halotolerans TaxID=3098930 RepID=UPI0038992F2A